MKIETPETHIGIIGGGPMALMLYKRLIESGLKNLKITIFEKQNQLGAGMPYSSLGANDEHVTNVSDIEIPELVMPMKEWIKTAPTELLKRFDINSANFNEYKVVPRLLLGEYLSDQFEILLEHSKKIGLKTVVKFETAVTDVVDERDSLTIVTNKGEVKGLHHIMIATGHQWSAKNDKKFKNYFDSPYPPSKLKIKANYPVAIKGASLTAIDAIRTLARENGCFSKNEDGSLTYTLNDDSPEFSLILHSIDGLLPAIRFHLEDVHHSDDSVLSDEETKEVMDANDGFIPLDYLFERNFKNSFIKKDSDFYQEIKNLTIEAFVEKMMALREKLDAFVLFKAEYAEAEKSIKRKESIYWKEMLTELSFAMNYPAKHFSAEDMIRLKKVLMPLISIVIAHVPQSSCRELIALYDANVLTLIEVNPESKVDPAENGGGIYHYANADGQTKSAHYKLFVDSVGQPPFSFEDFPFKSLIESESVSPARLRFRSNNAGAKEIGKNENVEKDPNGSYYLKVPGININDNFQVLNNYGATSDRIFVVAVPYIAGYNPDYSGLDFCEEASARVVSHLSTLSSLK